MPTYKITYFNVRYRPEITRLMFVVTDVDFDDVRVHPAYQDPTEFKDLKASGKLPMGQVPIMEVDGRVMVQSRAIQRYVAREVGLYGGNNLEAEEIDEVTETFDDLLEDAAPWLYRESDPKKVAELKKDYKENKAPPRLSFLSKKLELSSSGYFVGSNMTVADLAVFNILDILSDNMPEVITPYPKLLNLKAKVEVNERIAKYLASRPKTPF